jgi:hypothetical protein
LAWTSLVRSRYLRAFRERGAGQGARAAAGLAALLATDTERPDDVAVPLDVLVLQIIEQTAPPPDQEQ